MTRTYIDPIALRIDPTIGDIVWKSSGILPSVVESYAIEFSPNESHNLAGPFRYNDKDYGLLILTKYEEKRTMDEILLDLKNEKYSTPMDDTYMPLDARKKLQLILGIDGTEFYWDKITKTNFSGLDLKYGSSSLDPEIVKRAKQEYKGQKCQFFWTTPGALDKIYRLISLDDLRRTYESLSRAYQEVSCEIQKTQPCKENPWMIYLYGNDDSSWTCTTTDQKEANIIIDNIKQFGFSYIYENMKFTN